MNAMDPLKNLRALAKAGRVVEIAKAIVADDKGYIDEHEFTELVTEHAQREHPGMTLAQAFAKAFGSNDETGKLLRQAHAVVKDSTIRVVFGDGFAPLQVGGEDVNPNDPSEAIAQLQELGRVRWPDASKDVQFMRAFKDPANAKLAARAHRRPTATTSFASPK